MKHACRALALAAIILVSACGGGGSGAPATSLTPAVHATPSPGAANATATITLKFPAHVKKATAAKTSSATNRKPAYINPNGGSLVVSVNGTALYDPNNLTNAYFSLGTQDLTTGTSTIEVSIASGTYQTGSIAITEYDQNNGTGNVLAYGFNNSYTDSNGNYQSGILTIVPGGTISPVITMAMNVGGIAITTDPVNGSDAQILSSSGQTNLCASAGQVYYFFPADLSNTIVLPGQSPAGGYTGGDDSNGLPGVPTVTLSYQYSNNGPPQASLAQSILGGGVYVLNAASGSETAYASFQVQNPMNGLSPAPPFSYNAYPVGNLDVGPGNC